MRSISGLWEVSTDDAPNKQIAFRTRTNVRQSGDKIRTHFNYQLIARVCFGVTDGTDHRLWSVRDGGKEKKSVLCDQNEKKRTLLTPAHRR